MGSGSVVAGTVAGPQNHSRSDDGGNHVAQRMIGGKDLLSVSLRISLSGIDSMKNQSTAYQIPLLTGECDADLFGGHRFGV